MHFRNSDTQAVETACLQVCVCVATSMPQTKEMQAKVGSRPFIGTICHISVTKIMPNWHGQPVCLKQSPGGLHQIQISELGCPYGSTHPIYTFWRAQTWFKPAVETKFFVL
jgi:hypothetical protein